MKNLRKPGGVLALLLIAMTATSPVWAQGMTMTKSKDPMGGGLPPISGPALKLEFGAG